MTTPTNVILPEGVTLEMAEAARANPGQTISSAGVKHRVPEAHVPITGYGTNLTPRVKGQEDAPRVTAPNISKYNKAHADRRLAEIEAEEKLEADHKALADYIDPVKLKATIQAMSRKINKLEKQLKEVTNA